MRQIQLRIFKSPIDHHKDPKFPIRLQICVKHRRKQPLVKRSIVLLRELFYNIQISRILGDCIRTIPRGLGVRLQIKRKALTTSKRFIYLLFSWRGRSAGSLDNLDNLEELVDSKVDSLDFPRIWRVEERVVRGVQRR